MICACLQLHKTGVLCCVSRDPCPLSTSNPPSRDIFNMTWTGEQCLGQVLHHLYLVHTHLIANRDVCSDLDAVNVISTLPNITLHRKKIQHGCNKGKGTDPHCQYNMSRKYCLE